VDVALLHHDGQRGKLVLRDLDQIQVVAMADIIRCASDGRYTTVHFTGGRPPFTVSVHLLEYERMLAPSGFIRIHRSHLINLAHLLRVDKRQLMVHLTDGHAVPISTRKRDDLMARL
jgi:two-component system LytT family response regulator